MVVPFPLGSFAPEGLEVVGCCIQAGVAHFERRRRTNNGESQLGHECVRVARQRVPQLGEVVPVRYRGTASRSCIRVDTMSPSDESMRVIECADIAHTSEAAF